MFCKCSKRIEALNHRTGMVVSLDVVIELLRQEAKVHAGVARKPASDQSVTIRNAGARDALRAMAKRLARLGT